MIKSINNKRIKGLILSTVLFSATAISAKINIVTEHLAPFQIVTKNSIGGLSTEIVEATLKEANIAYNIQAHPWSISYNRALKEENLCIYSLARIPERKALFQWVGHLSDSTISLYTLSHRSITIDNLAQAKNYKVAVIKDDVTHHFMLSRGFEENINLYVMNNYDALLNLLETPNRHIDLVLLNDDLLNNRLKNSSKAAKYKSVYLIDELTLNFHFACSLNTGKAIVTPLVQAMTTLEEQGAFTEIKNKWQKNMVNLIKVTETKNAN